MHRARFTAAADAESHSASAENSCRHRYGSTAAAAGRRGQQHRCTIRGAASATAYEEDTQQKKILGSSQVVAHKQKRSRDEQYQEESASAAALHSRIRTLPDECSSSNCSSSNCFSSNCFSSNCFSSNCSSSNCSSSNCSSSSCSSSSCSSSNCSSSDCSSSNCSSSDCSSSNCPSSNCSSSNCSSSNRFSSSCSTSVKGTGSDSGTGSREDYGRSDCNRDSRENWSSSMHSSSNSVPEGSNSIEAHYCFDNSSCDGSLCASIPSSSSASGGSQVEKKKQFFSEKNNCILNDGSSKPWAFSSTITCSSSSRCKEEKEMHRNDDRSSACSCIRQSHSLAGPHSSSTEDNALSPQQQGLARNYFPASEWTPPSWRRCPAAQNPFASVPAVALASVTERLKRLPPLVSPGEVDELLLLLRRVFEGQMLLLLGGDCAERFADCCEAVLMRKLQVLLHMALVLSSIPAAATLAGRDTAAVAAAAGGSAAAASKTTTATSERLMAEVGKTDERCAAAAAKEAPFQKAATAAARIIAPSEAAARRRARARCAHGARTATPRSAAAVQQAEDSAAGTAETQTDDASTSATGGAAAESSPAGETCGVVIIGRFAGQYGKPRTASHEEVNGRRVLTYRGDAVHDFDPSHREVDPHRLLQGRNRLREPTFQQQRSSEQPQTPFSFCCLYFQFRASYVSMTNVAQLKPSL